VSHQTVEARRKKLIEQGKIDPSPTIIVERNGTTYEQKKRQDNNGPKSWKFKSCPKLNRPGYVYVVRSLQNLQWIKIGITEFDDDIRPNEIIRGIGKGDIIYRFETQDRFWLENELHGFFKFYWQDHEWFELPETYILMIPSIVAQIEKGDDRDHRQLTLF
jgi:hypothetical protein